MSIHPENVLTVLCEYGQYCEQREKEPELPKLFLYRDREGGREVLRAVKENEMGFINRMKKMLGFRNFRLETIRKMVSDSFCVIQQADESTNIHVELLAKVILKDEKNSTYINKAILAMNKCFEDHNEKIDKSIRIFTRMLRREKIEKVELPKTILPLKTVDLEGEELTSEKPETTSIGETKKGAKKTRSATRKYFTFYDTSRTIDEGKPRAKITSDEIAGLQNPGNHCYCNALIKCLEASKGFRKMLEQVDNKSKVNTLLTKVFAKLETAGKGVSLSSDEGPYADLKTELAALFPPLNGFQQQDTGELMIPLLEVALQDTALSEEDMFIPERNPANFIKLVEYFEREREECMSDELAEKLKDSIPPLELLNILSTDRKKKVQPAPIVTVTIPSSRIGDEKNPFNIREVFDGYRIYEDVTIEAIIDKENEINPQLTEEQKEHFREVAEEHRGRVGTVPVVTGRKIDVKTPQEAPLCLPIYLARFEPATDAQGRNLYDVEGNPIYVKNQKPVTYPYTLTVQVGKGAATYVLRSVAIHDGGTKDTGHYHTYIPREPQAGEKEPSLWVDHSDTYVGFTTLQASGNKRKQPLEDIIRRNGCVFMYDRIDPPIPEA
jgi:hypothetical protein